MRVVSVIISAGLLLAVTPFFAAQTSPLSPLPPAPFTFSGKWACQGHFRGGKPHEAVFAGAVVVAGKWIDLTEVDTLPATGYSAMYLIGADPERHQLVEYDANNFAAATYSSADGWVGPVLTMTSAVSQNSQAPYAINRFLYSVVGPDTFTVDWQISKMAEPHWTTADHLTCKRTP